MIRLSFVIVIGFSFSLPTFGQDVAPMPPAWLDRPYEAFVNEAVGFGSKITGGKGFDLYTVTNLNASGSGSLTAALNAAYAAGGGWIRFQEGMSGDYTHAVSITGDNITLDGRGANIRFYNFYQRPRAVFVQTGARNIIITNFKVWSDYLSGGTQNGDGIRINGSRVWVDHVTSEHHTDEFFDLHYGPIGDPNRTGLDEILITWCRQLPYLPSHVPNLSGQTGGGGNHPYFMLMGDDYATGPSYKVKVTMHHNYIWAYDRLPNGRYTYFHSFNNVFGNWTWGAGAQYGAEIYMEGNYSENNRQGSSSWLLDIPSTRSNSTEATYGVNNILNGANIRISGSIFDPNTEYAAGGFIAPGDQGRDAIQTPQDAFDSIVPTGAAGWQDVPWPGN